MPPRPYVSVIFSPRRPQQARTFRSAAATATATTPGIPVSTKTLRGKTSHSEAEPRPKQDSAIIRVVAKRFLQSPAEALAVIRATERKYGSIREYRFQRDFELPSYYQNTLYIAFHDPAAFNRIPTRPESFTLTLPRIVSDQPGGIGLEDLKEHLVPEEYNENTALPSFESVMDDVANNTGKGKEQVTLTIERSRINWGSTPSSEDSPRSNRASQSFIQWAGFHALQPIPAETPMSIGAMTPSSTVDHIAMRRALRLHSKLLNKPNPYEIYTDTTSPGPSTPMQHWEPLPGVNSTPTDTPMPSVIELSPEQLSVAPDATSHPVEPLFTTVDEPTVKGSLPLRSIPFADASTTPPTSPQEEATAKHNQENQQQKNISSKKNRDRLLQDQSSQRSQPQEPKNPPKQDINPGENLQHPATIKHKLSSFFSNIL